MPGAGSPPLEGSHPDRAHGRLDDGTRYCHAAPVDRRKKAKLDAWLCRFGFRCPAEYRESDRLIRESRRLYEVAGQLSQSTPSPLDAAPLVRKALVQLFAALLRLDGHEVTTSEECRNQILASEDHRKLFAEVVDDLPFLDELISSFELLQDDQEGPRDRFRQLMKAVPKVHRRVRARFDARLRADGARLRPTRALVGAALVMAAAFVAVALNRHGSSNPTAEQAAHQGGRPVAGGPDSGAQRNYLGRCFETTFFSDQDFQTPVHSRRDCQIAFDWGEGSVPDVPSLSPDSFSIRWEGVLEPPRSDRYTFHLTSDDGSRLYLNDELVIDNWGAHGPVTVSSTAIDLSANAEVPIVVEYFEVGGIAQVKLSWSSSAIEKQPLSGQYIRPHRGGLPTGGAGEAQGPGETNFGPSQCFTGRYFFGRDFQRLARERRDCRIQFDWGAGAAPGIDGLPSDDFSVRWEGTLQVPATDDYVFYLGSDDGSRLYLNGELVVGDWSEHGFRFDESPKTRLTEGIAYPIVVEFFDAKELATVRLDWSSSTLPRSPLSGRHVSKPSSESPGTHQDALSPAPR